jgi:CHAT domain-containing protein
VVSSLWNVGDESAAFWMRDFYRALRHDAGDVARAARDASVATRDWARSHGGADSPHAWGAFVVAGGP